MKRVYLDQNKWIDLSRAFHGRPGGEPYQEVLKLCFARREQGEAGFPVAAQHFMELGKRRDPESRKRLADFMATLSDGDTMASYTAVVPKLVARYCQGLAGVAVAGPPPTFGKGLSFAFGHDAVSPRERAANPEMAAFIEKKLASPTVLADLLANPQGDDRERMAAEIQLNATKVAEAAEFMRQSRAGVDPALFELSLLYRIALSSRHEIQQACGVGGADPELCLGDPDRIRRGIAQIPPLAVEHELILDQVMQAHRKVQPNDMVDIATMSMAIPYCDIVVAEKHWAHVCNRLGLARRHGTIVLTNVNELADHL